jgi:hypothetical protein
MGRGSKITERLNQSCLIQKFSPQKLGVFNRRILGNSLPQVAKTLETLMGQDAFIRIAGVKIDFNFLYQMLFTFFQNQHDYTFSPASSAQNILYHYQHYPGESDKSKFAADF